MWMRSFSLWNKTYCLFSFMSKFWFILFFLLFLSVFYIPNWHSFLSLFCCSFFLFRMMLYIIIIWLILFLQFPIFINTYSIKELYWLLFLMVFFLDLVFKCLSIIIMSSFLTNTNLITFILVCFEIFL